MRLRQVVADRQAGLEQQTGLVDSTIARGDLDPAPLSCRMSAIMCHGDISTTMISMRHVRRADAATVLSRPSRLQTRSRSRAVDDVRAASDPARG